MKLSSPLTLLSLVLGLTLPTCGIIWLMADTIEKERIVSQKKIEDIYQSRIDKALSDWQMYWLETVTFTNKHIDNSPPLQLYYKLVSHKDIAGATLHSDEGHILYPKLRINSEFSVHQSESWKKARNDEFRQGDFLSAIARYKKIITSTNLDEILSAYLAISRCYSKLGDGEAALATLNEALGTIAVNNEDALHDKYLDIHLRRAQLLVKLGISSATELGALAGILNNYESYHFFSDQRVHAVQQAIELSANQNIALTFPFFKKEKQSIKLLSASEKSRHILVGSRSKGTFIAIKQDSLLDYLNEKMRAANLEGASFSLSDKPSISGNLIFQTQLDDAFSPTYISASWYKKSTLDKRLNAHSTAYLWTGILLIFSIIISTFLLHYSVSEQRKLNQIKNDLIAIVAHEFSTPLNATRLLLDNMLNSERSDLETQSEYLQLLNGENERLIQLVNKFLTFSRMENGQHKLQKSIVNADEFLKDTIDLFKGRDKIAPANIQISFNTTKPVNIDKKMMEIALFNLLENAKKYSPEPSTITVNLNSSSSKVNIEVVDQGIGIPAKQQKKIFARFFRLDNRLSRTTEGVGLGLSIVNTIVKNHGGNIGVHSIEGKGSTFTISLPIANKV